MAETTLGAKADLEKRIRELLSLHFSADSPINKFLLTAQLQRLPAFLFGGTLRDLLAFGALPRDLDIVVRASNLEKFAGDFKRYLVRQTRFGGMHFVVDGWHFDVWPLRETWAFRKGLVTPRIFSTLPLTTFLNVEAVAAELRLGPTGSRKLFEAGFFEAMSTQTVEINLEENPFPDLCIVRSLLTAARLGFDIGPKLAKYLVSRSEGMTVANLGEVQLRHYGEIRADPEEMMSWLAFVKQSWVPGVSRIRLPLSEPRKLALQGGWSS
jgi:hypothetical protein